ncbi:MAG: hypothetical protein OEM81_08990 [Acidimicrobiia bacterium]|nr:hypothetical protein [Acidimicrobiia bacterium]
MRRVALLCGVSLLLWACTEGAASTTTTSAPSTSPSSSSTTVSTPSSSTSVASTTTSIVPEWPVVEVLVTNQDGVFYVDSAGEVSQLVIGRVVYAVDDTRGG